MEMRVTVEGKETMKLKTAAQTYDVTEDTLRDMCIKGKVKARKVGKMWFIPVSEMNRVFKVIL